MLEFFASSELVIPRTYYSVLFESGGDSPLSSPLPAAFLNSSSLGATGAPQPPSKFPVMMRIARSSRAKP